MKKVFIPIIVIVAAFTIVILVGHINEEVIEVYDTDSTFSDSLSQLEKWYMSNEGMLEMMQKGVQGDFTLEQVDSMQNSWE